MTDPDHRRNRNHSRSQISSQATPDERFPQPDFFTAAHSQHDNVSSREGNDPFLDTVVHGTGSGVVQSGPSVIHVPEVMLPLGNGAVPSGPSAMHIPEVVLPPGWDAPLRHPIPVDIPAVPVFPP